MISSPCRNRGSLHFEPSARALIPSKSYGDGVCQYLLWCSDNNKPADLPRATVAGFVASLIDNGAAPTTARAPQLAVRRFSAWLTDEQGIPVDPLGIRAPNLDTLVVEPLTEDEIKAMLKACGGRDPRERR